MARGRWFFVRITGRRRIGKTTLLQRGLGSAAAGRLFYVQIPDSAPAGGVGGPRPTATGPAALPVRTGTV